MNNDGPWCAACSKPLPCEKHHLAIDSNGEVIVTQKPLDHTCLHGVSTRTLCAECQV